MDTKPGVRRLVLQFLYNTTGCSNSFQILISFHNLMTLSLHWGTVRVFHSRGCKQVFSVRHSDLHSSPSIFILQWNTGSLKIRLRYTHCPLDTSTAIDIPAMSTDIDSHSTTCSRTGRTTWLPRLILTSILDSAVVENRICRTDSQDRQKNRNEEHWRRLWGRRQLTKTDKEPV